MAFTPSTFSVPVSRGELSLWQVALWENEFLIAWRNPFSHKIVSVTPVRQNYVRKMDSALPLLHPTLAPNVCMRAGARASRRLCAKNEGIEKEDERVENRKETESINLDIFL